MGFEDMHGNPGNTHRRDWEGPEPMKYSALQNESIVETLVAHSEHIQKTTSSGLSALQVIKRIRWPFFFTCIQAIAISIYKQSCYVQRGR